MRPPAALFCYEGPGARPTGACGAVQDSAKFCGWACYPHGIIFPQSPGPIARALPPASPPSPRPPSPPIEPRSVASPPRCCCVGLPPLHHDEKGHRVAQGGGPVAVVGGRRRVGVPSLSCWPLSPRRGTFRPRRAGRRGDPAHDNPIAVVGRLWQQLGGFVRLRRASRAGAFGVDCVTVV